MRASVATMPRTVSSENSSSSTWASGRRTKASHRSSSPTRAGHLRLGAQRLEHGREDPLGQLLDAPVELLPRGILTRAAGELREAGRGRLGVPVVDEQPPTGLRRDGGERREPSPDQPDVEIEVGDDLLRQQRDEVGVARQPRVHSRERPGRHGGAADVVGRLQHQHAPACTGEVCRGGEPVVPRTDDDVVVVHRASLRAAVGSPHATLRRRRMHAASAMTSVTRARGAASAAAWRPGGREREITNG